MLASETAVSALLPVSLSHLVVGGEGVLLFVGGVVGVAREAW